MPDQLAKTVDVNFLKQEISHLIEQIILWLDTIYSLPFHNNWLTEPPGKEYLQLLLKVETFLLWSWNGLENQDFENFVYQMQQWEGQQMRSSRSLLRDYYCFYEALGNWSQVQSDPILRGEGQWYDFIFSTLWGENHMLNRLSGSSYSPAKEELELLAQQYLSQMQTIGKGDPYPLSESLFTFIGGVTQKSYFVPRLNFTSEVAKTSKSFFFSIKQQFNETNQWSSLAVDYLDHLIKWKEKQLKPTP